MTLKIFLKIIIMKKLNYVLVFLFSIFCIQTQTGFTQWYSQNPLPSGLALWSVSFANPNTGFAIGDCGMIRKTTNGGWNWTILNTGSINNVSGISFPDENTGYTAGNPGTILKSTNGGINWISLNSGCNVF